METLTYVTIGHYGEYDDYETNVEYVGNDVDKAFEIIKSLDYHEIGMPFKNAHVEVWNEGTHLSTYDSERNLTWFYTQSKP